LSELVLITGGAGFIGTHTAHELLRLGYRVRALDFLAPPVHEPGKRPPWLEAEVELLVGDILDKPLVARALKGVDRVLHLAAYQDYLPDFSTFFRINTAGTALIYELIVEGRLPIRKVVVASSQAAYGEGRHECPEHGPVYPDIRSEKQLGSGDWEVHCPKCDRQTEWKLTDEAVTNPQNQYGLSKLTQEMVAFSLGKRYNIPTTCLRYSISQGKWQSPRNAYSGICRIFTLRALAGKPAIVFEDGQQVRDYVYAGDVAKANVLALTDDRTDGEAYNVGGGELLSAFEYAKVVQDVLGVRVEPELPGYYRFGDTRHMVSDVSKLEALGWKPTLKVREVVAEYAGWVTSQGFKDSSDDAIERMLRLGTLRAAGARVMGLPTNVPDGGT
jgi:dTDP-L-rhamnose 4-epimerase